MERQITPGNLTVNPLHPFLQRLDVCLLQSLQIRHPYGLVFTGNLFLVAFLQYAPSPFLRYSFHTPFSYLHISPHADYLLRDHDCSLFVLCFS